MQLVDAHQIEDMFEGYLEMTKSNAEIAIAWRMKLKRLIRQKDYNQAHTNIM